MTLLGLPHLEKMPDPHPPKIVQGNLTSGDPSLRASQPSHQYHLNL